MPPTAARTVAGPSDAPALLLVHGFGTDRSIWDRMVPTLAAAHRVVTVDHRGCGQRPPGDPVRYADLDAYVDDLLVELEALGADDVTLVGHSVGAAICLQAAAARPELVRQVVSIGGSARYLDDDGYVGGFSLADVDDVVAAIEENYPAWAAAMAGPLLGGEAVAHVDELRRRLTHLDPTVAAVFARATFHADVRRILPQVTAPVLVLHCRDDVIVPDPAAEALVAALPDARLVRLEATGHCPLLSAPEELLDHLGAALTPSVA